MTLPISSSNNNTVRIPDQLRQDEDILSQIERAEDNPLMSGITEASSAALRI
jgi:hypothetical protein